MNMTKKVLVIGASEKPFRFSNKAVRLLRNYDYEVEAIGLRPGKIFDVEIITGFPDLKDINSITLYIGPARQPVYYDYILNLKPERIIFNPGTENVVFKEMAKSRGIEVVENCTLVMLNSGIF